MYTFFFALFLLLPSFTSAALDPATKNYLENPPVDDWSAIALGQNGHRDITLDYVVETSDTTTDLARKILAMTAQGVDPRDMNNTDFVVALLNTHLNGQFGNANLTNDDAWSIIALRNANVAATHPALVTSVTLLKNSQQQDGGWGFSTLAPSDTDDTAAVLMALREARISHDDSVVTRGRAYLVRARNSDGGYGFMPGQPSNSASTAWIVWAKSYLGDADTLGRNFLQAQKLPDGSFRWRPTDTTGSRLITAYAAIALASIPLSLPPVVASPSPPPVSATPPPLTPSTPTTPIITSSTPTPAPVVTETTTNSNPSATITNTPETATLISNQPLPLRLILDRGTVRVGEPIVAWVEAQHQAVWKAVTNVRIIGTPVPLIHADVHGTRIFFVKADTYRLQAEGEGYLTSPSETVVALPLTEIKPHVQTSSPPARRVNSRRRVSRRSVTSRRTPISNGPVRLPILKSRQR